METRGRKQYRSGDRSGDGNERSSGDGNGHEDRIGDENDDGTDAIRHFFSVRVIIFAERGWCLRSLKSSVRKALYPVHAYHTEGVTGPRHRKVRTGSGARSEWEAGTKMGTG